MTHRGPFQPQTFYDSVGAASGCLQVAGFPATDCCFLSCCFCAWDKSPFFPYLVAQLAKGGSKNGEAVAPRESLNESPESVLWWLNRAERKDDALRRVGQLQDVKYI